MVQKSVYCKMVLNQTAALAVLEQIKKEKPDEGIVQVLTLTEKQYARMEYVIGANTSDIVDSDERLVVL